MSEQPNEFTLEDLSLSAEERAAIENAAQEEPCSSPWSCLRGGDCHRFHKRAKGPYCARLQPTIQAAVAASSVDKASNLDVLPVAILDGAANE